MEGPQNKYRADENAANGGAGAPQQEGIAQGPSLLRRAWNFFAGSRYVIGATATLSAGGAATYFAGNPLYLYLGFGALGVAAAREVVVDAIESRREERESRREALSGAGRGEMHDLRRVKPVENKVFDGEVAINVAPIAAARRGRRNSMNGEEVFDSDDEVEGPPAQAWSNSMTSPGVVRNRRHGVNEADGTVLTDYASPTNSSVTSPQGKVVVSPPENGREE